MDVKQLKFENTLYQDILDRDPSNTDVRLQLAYNYYYIGREENSSADYEKSLEHDLVLLENAPDNAMYQYNIACDYALLGRIEKSYQFLERAVRLGIDYETLVRDPDFEPMRRDTRFTRILSKAKEKTLTDRGECDE